jgi:hypothetical protein
MRVKTYTMNKGTSSQYFGLKNADEGFVLPYAPNNWKTKNGAIRWAIKNGMEVAE